MIYVVRVRSDAVFGLSSKRGCKEESQLATIEHYIHRVIQGDAKRDCLPIAKVPHLTLYKLVISVH